MIDIIANGVLPRVLDFEFSPLMAGVNLLSFWHGYRILIKQADFPFLIGISP